MTAAVPAGAHCHVLHPDAVVARLAARQHGVVTVAQLAEAGIGRRGVAHRVATGRLTRLHRGVYLVGPAEMPYTAEMAALLTCGVERSGLSLATAGAVWGLGPKPPIVHVSTTANVRQRQGIRVHRTTGLEVTTHHGLRVTTPTRTLVDLATVLRPRELEWAINEALVRGLTTHADLTASLPSRSSRALLTEPTLTRSEAEMRLKDLIRRAGLPHARTNVRVGGYEVDFLWPQQRLIVEVDGYAFHSTRHAFERDRAKDAWLVAQGHRVIRVTWRQIVHHPEAVVARLGAALRP